MARNESESTPVLKCPHCGCRDTDEMLFKQMVPATFYILVEGGGIEVDTESINMDVAKAGGGLLYCCDCEKDFPVPAGFDTTYA